MSTLVWLGLLTVMGIFGAVLVVFAVIVKRDIEADYRPARDHFERFNRK